MDDSELQLKLEAAKKMLPYLKLVEREKLRVRFETEKEYDDFFNSAEVNKLLRELISDKLAISQITTVLENKPLSAREMSEILRVDISEISRHLKSSAKQGLVDYDEGQKRFAIAT